MKPFSSASIIFPCLLMGAAMTLPAQAQAPVQDETETQREMVCSRDSFVEFFTEFSRDIAVQEKSVADVLIYESIDIEAEPEPKKVFREVPLAEVEWPIINHWGQWLNAGREVTFEASGRYGMRVQVRTPDTSDQQTYGFSTEGGCWKLVWITDESV